MSSREPQTFPRSSSVRFHKPLLAWYDAHARELPWRQPPGSKKHTDPYRVWLSEIMLQQTRVAAVIGHYHEFLRRFPTVQKLAAAREASVLAAWSGLGYYRRARMLHAAAKVIARERGGEFPVTAQELRALPGIGRYTAAAIASIAFGEPAAVVDGNVERVLQRILGRRLAGEDLWNAAGELLDRNRPGDFNQAMMELGATICTPRAPACLTCPVVELCATRGELAGITKAARQKKREIHYALDLREEDTGHGKIFLVQRPQNASLMAGMWELPEIEGPGSGAKAPPNGAGEIAALKAQRHPKAKRRANNGAVPHRGNGLRRLSIAPERPESSNLGACLTIKHSITVTDYAVHVWRGASPEGVVGQWAPVNRLGRVALTGLARKILHKAKILQKGSSAM